MTVLLANIQFNDTIGIGALAIAIGIGIAQFSTSRKDKRYQIAADERNEYRQQAERLQMKCDRLQEKCHELELEVTRLNGEVETLKQFPQVKELSAAISLLIERVDKALLRRNGNGDQR